MYRLPPLFRWSRSTGILLSGFFLVIGLIVYVWWPLADEYLAYIDWQGPWWLYMDWLLIGIFVFMSLAIVARADLRTDGLIILVGSLGGLAIESWGTRSNIWSYYTGERPPLWIIPAWPIASLAIDRIARLLDHLVARAQGAARGAPHFPVLYWFTFATFFALMLDFVAPTLDMPTTLLALALCVSLILTPTDERFAFLTFAAGTGLGYFLERWGTTRQCWTYYTLETPPLFAVLAHGMAAVAFWRVGLILKTLMQIRLPRGLPARAPDSPSKGA